jgi:hypothetical protein
VITVFFAQSTWQERTYGWLRLSARFDTKTDWTERGVGAVPLGNTLNRRFGSHTVGENLGGRVNLVRDEEEVFGPGQVRFD